MSRFRQFSAFVLCCTLAVILWGGYVRASGSGAGCGSHWPTCNGEVIPRPKTIATVIEFTHRASSGVAFFLVVAQLVWAFRRFSPGHLVRRAATASMIFMVSEAGVGAGLVLFKMVAKNESVARGAWIASHLLNTFALLASLALTWWLADTGNRPRSASAPSRGLLLALVIGGAGTLLVATSGAIAALGDTLFPAHSFTEALAQDVSPTAHLFLRLRVLHPVLAVATALLLLVVAALLASSDRPSGIRPLATALGAFVLLQVGAGLLNLALLAPIPLQLVHLFMADLVWLALVLTAFNLRRSAGTESPR